jgi:hypothetical protein
MHVVVRRVMAPGCNGKTSSSKQESGRNAQGHTIMQRTTICDRLAATKARHCELANGFLNHAFGSTGAGPTWDPETPAQPVVSLQNGSIAASMVSSVRQLAVLSDEA